MNVILYDHYLLYFLSKMASTTVLLESLDLIREHHFNNAQKGEILFPGNPGGVSGIGGHGICQFFLNNCKLGITKLYLINLNTILLLLSSRHLMPDSYSLVRFSFVYAYDSGGWKLEGIFFEVMLSMYLHHLETFGS